MRLWKDFQDYLALRRQIQAAWRFVRSRKRLLDGPYYEVRFLDGGALRLRMADRQVFKDVFARDEYGLDAYRPGELGWVIDIGAHVGTFAARVAPLARRVVSYEPCPENYDLLVHNVGRFPHVTARRHAVAGQRATARLYVAGDPSTHSLFHSWTRRPSDASIGVDTVTLADIFQEFAIDECDLLKIDCEGAEYDILLSAPIELWRRVRRVALEYHPLPSTDATWSGEGLARRLEQAGHRTRLKPRSRHRAMGILFSTRR